MLAGWRSVSSALFSDCSRDKTQAQGWGRAGEMWLLMSRSLFSQAPKEALAQCVLAEIPQQLVGYFNTYKLLPPKNLATAK